MWSRVIHRYALRMPILSMGMLALCAGSLLGAGETRFTGRIVGIVKGNGGAAQMGATVQLLNRFGKPILRAMTDDRGAFVFDSLGPETYSVRVSLSSFVPALRGNIAIGPGTERYLAIQLASLFSSIEVFYAPPPGSFLMSEDWRAALRSSLSTRPVLRALPTWDPLPTPQTRNTASSRIFSDTKGVVQLSSGDTATNFSWGAQPDLGTSFAVGTSVMGRSQVQFSGNLGYGLASGIPAAGFRTTYQRKVNAPVGFDVPNPQISVTMRQLYVPLRAGTQNGTSPNSGAPVLRTLSSTFSDRFQISDSLLVEYGASLDSVQYVDRLNYLSPYARFTWDGRSFGTVRAAYSSGLPPIDLLISGTGEDAEMQRQLSSLALFPRITRRGGTTQAQRVQNYELGYGKRFKFGEAFVSGYREQVANASLATIGAPESMMGDDLVPDLSTNANIFNIGNYRRQGVVAGWTQNLFRDFKLTTAYGSGGVLRTDQRVINPAEGGEAAAIRSGIYSSQKHFASMKFTGTIPTIGTRVYSSYLWTDYRALTPFHTSLTTPGLPEAGLNIGIKQPVPGFLGMPGRLEFSAEMRNMLAQGYLPIVTPDGRTMWLLPTPKQVRGGLSFIF
jgi:hypothetical protein